MQPPTSLQDPAVVEPPPSAEAVPKLRVQSVGRAAEILQAVAVSPQGLVPREISEQTGLSRQTVYHLIHTLVSVRLLRRGRDNRLTLGLAVGTLAAAFQRQVAPQEHLQPYVNALAERTSELAYAATFQDGEIQVVAVARGTSIIQAREVSVGNTADGHARASGKLLLARMSDADREQYLRTHKLTRRTPHTIVDRRALERALEGIREQGYATDDEEFAEGLGCIAVPLGSTPYVIGISVPAQRFHEERDRYVSIALEVGRESEAGGS